MVFPWDSHAVLPSPEHVLYCPLSTQSTSHVPQSSENKPEVLQSFWELDFLVFLKDKSSLIWCTGAVRDYLNIKVKNWKSSHHFLTIVLAFPCQNLRHDTAEIKWPKGFWILLGVRVSSRPSSNVAVRELVYCPFQLLYFVLLLFVLSVSPLFV